MLVRHNETPFRPAILIAPADRSDKQLAVTNGIGDQPGSQQGRSRRTSITVADPSSSNLKEKFFSSTESENKAFRSRQADDEDAKEKVELEDEDDSIVDTRPFPSEFTPLKLARLVDPKSIQALTELGGADGVLKALGTDAKHGISGSHPVGTASSPFAASLEDRQRVYGRNMLPSRKSMTLLQLMWKALKDKVLVLLSAAAIISLALGLFQDFGTSRPTFTCGNGEVCTRPPVDWVEGVAIMAAVSIVVVFGSLNDYQKEKQFRALNDKKEDRTVKVIRDGAEKVVNVKVCHTLSP